MNVLTGRYVLLLVQSRVETEMPFCIFAKMRNFVNVKEISFCEKSSKDFSGSENFRLNRRISSKCFRFCENKSDFCKNFRDNKSFCEKLSKFLNSAKVFTKISHLCGCIGPYFPLAGLEDFSNFMPSWEENDQYIANNF